MDIWSGQTWLYLVNKHFLVELFLIANDSATSLQVGQETIERPHSHSDLLQGQNSGFRMFHQAFLCPRSDAQATPSEVNQLKFQKLGRFEKEKKNFLPGKDGKFPFRLRIAILRLKF